jgi:hypothetical protein
VVVLGEDALAAFGRQSSDPVDIIDPAGAELVAEVLDEMSLGLNRGPQGMRKPWWQVVVDEELHRSESVQEAILHLQRVFHLLFVELVPVGDGRD